MVLILPGRCCIRWPKHAMEGRMMGKPATKKTTMKPESSVLQEVTTLREPVRPFTHCGLPMRKFSHPATLGGLNTVFVCAKECGHREQITTTGR